MTKVLYIGPYKDGTGWSHAAIENILALDAAGVDVVCRPMKLNDANGEVPAKLLELESKSDKNCNIVIQNCLPHHTDYNGSFDKNIAYYFSETSHFRNSSWAERLNLLDEAWVPCRSVVKASRESFVDIPIAVIPVPCNVEKYQKKYEPLDMPHLKDKFVFYTIGEVHRRKNLVALLKAYHLEFGPQEPVALVIKGSLPGMHPVEVDRHIGEICNKTKDQLKLYQRPEVYLPETIITQHLSEEEMMRLHVTCDCYVSPSYGEGWNMPAFDAMAFGKTPICTAQGGPLDYLSWSDASVKNEDGSFTNDPRPIGYELSSLDGCMNRYGSLFPSNAGWLVSGNTEPVFGMKDGTFPDLYVGNEDWYSVDIRELRKAMRQAFEDSDERKKRAEYGILRAYDFSHVKVGELMRDILNGTKEQAIFHGGSCKVREKHSFQKVGQP